jgi:hypothetical protein
MLLLVGRNWLIGLGYEKTDLIFKDSEYRRLIADTIRNSKVPSKYKGHPRFFNDKSITTVLPSGVLVFAWTGPSGNSDFKMLWYTNPTSICQQNVVA